MKVYSRSVIKFINRNEIEKNRVGRRIKKKKRGRSLKTERMVNRKTKVFIRN
jgi:hypothetical protein